MSGADRCDAILRLIDEALEDAELVVRRPVEATVRVQPRRP
jgi:hypothetical protein